MAAGVTGNGDLRSTGASHAYELGERLVVYNCFLRAEVALLDLAWAQRDPRLGPLFAGLDDPPAPVVLPLGEAALSECLAHLDAIRERDGADRGEAFDWRT